MMEWECTDCGCWEAESQWNDGGCPFVWRIFVNDDGMFSLANTTKELMPTTKMLFDTFKKAKAWCEKHETEDRS